MKTLPPLGTQCRRGRQLVSVWGDQCALKLMARPVPSQCGQERHTGQRNPGWKRPHEQTLARACSGSCFQPPEPLHHQLPTAQSEGSPVPPLLGCPGPGSASAAERMLVTCTQQLQLSEVGTATGSQHPGTRAEH